MAVELVKEPNKTPLNNMSVPKKNNTSLTRKNMTKPGIIIAQLTSKKLKKTSQNHSYYLLQLILYQNLTQLYFQLTRTKTPPLKKKVPLYLFPEKNKWGTKLKVGSTYYFQYQKQNDYFHLTDWKLLGDQETVKRAWRLLKNDQLTNRIRNDE